MKSMNKKIRLEVDQEICALIEEINNAPEFKKNDQLLNDCKNVVIDTIVGPFGLSAHMFEDKDGGNITTLHNFEKGIVANEKDQQRYDEWQETVNNPIDRKSEHKAHDVKKDAWKKNTFQNTREGETVKDGYTGKDLGKKENGRINKNKSIDAEHVTPVAEVERDAKNHLYAQGDTKQTRVEDRAELTGNENNLTLTEGGLNSSKGDKDLKEWEKGKVSDKHAKETGNPDMTNGEFYEVDPDLVDEKYKKSKDFFEKEARKRQFKKQGKEFLVEGSKESAKIMLRTFIGQVLKELVEGVFQDVRKIMSEGYESIEHLLKMIKERIKTTLKSIKEKWKKYLEVAAISGLSGFLSSLTTLIINFFKTTAKNLVKFIREGVLSLMKAIKILTFPPEGLSTSERISEATKILGSALIVMAGIAVEESVKKAIETVPILAPMADELSLVVTGLITGLGTVLFLHLFDKVKSSIEFYNAEMAKVSKGQQLFLLQLKKTFLVMDDYKYHFEYTSEKLTLEIIENWEGVSSASSESQKSLDGYLSSIDLLKNLSKKI